MRASDYEVTYMKSSIKEYFSQNGQNYRVIIFGCTPYAKDIKSAVENCGVRVGLIIDNSSAKGKESMGIPVALPKEGLLPYNDKNLIIICSKFYQEMIGQVKEYGYSEKNILNILVDECSILDVNIELEFEKAKRNVIEGYQLYLEICSKYAAFDKMFLCPYPGTGDIYMACALLEDYLAKQNIEKYIFVVIGGNCKRVADLFYVMNIEVLDSAKMQQLLHAWSFLGDRMNIKPLLYWNWRVKRFMRSERKREIPFAECFQFDVFENERMMPIRHFKPVYDYEWIEKIFEEKELKKGRTVVLAPYAGSFVPDMTVDDWKSIADTLKKKGYTVCTNSSGEKEPVIPGTVPVFFAYDRAIGFLEYAGGFIAFRSGLCDVVSQAKCKMVVFYDNNYNAAKMDFFSLKKMGLREDVEELVWTEDTLRMIDEIFA
ncbi:MAG: hypothetical protein LUE96_08795 [Lachnospiraceae bacterium]|nr:hypothetical protein [Lachnospiraceae bacterium]